VRRQGIVVSLRFVTGLHVSFNIRDFFFEQKQLRGTLMGSAEGLAWGLEQVRKGKIRPLLSKLIPLGKANAHELLALSEVTGNLDLNPWE